MACKGMQSDKMSCERCLKSVLPCTRAVGYLNLVDVSKHFTSHLPQVHTATHLVLAECVSERLDGLDVEVVGGLVHDQEVGAVPAQHRERHTGLLPSRQGVDLLEGLKCKMGS